MRSWLAVLAVVSASVFLVGHARAAEIEILETGTGLANVEIAPGETPTLSFDVILTLAPEDLATAYATSITWDGSAIVGGTDPFLGSFVGTPVPSLLFPIALGPLGLTQSAAGVAGSYDSIGGVSLAPVSDVTLTIATLSVTVLPGTVAGDGTWITPFFGAPDGVSGPGGAVDTDLFGASIQVVPEPASPALLGLGLAGLAMLRRPRGMS